MDLSLMIKTPLFHSQIPSKEILAIALLAGISARAFALEVDFRATALRDEIRFDWALTPDQRDAVGKSQTVRVLEWQGHSAQRPEAGSTATPLAVEGSTAEQTLKIPRFAGERDRLFSRFELQMGSPPHTIRWVTDFENPGTRTHSLGATDSKKGVTCLMDPADGLELGARQLNQNIIIGSLLDLTSPTPPLSFVYEGRPVGLNPRGVAALDHDLLTAYRNRQRVTGILLNLVGKNTPHDSPLVHPLTPRETVPIGPSAFNTATAEGLFYFRAIVHWLVERYTRADAEFGHLAGLVIGNEIQSHWSWYHLGATPAQTVIREYAHALRVADLAARNVHAGFRSYVSLDHHWAISAAEDPLKGFSGVEALEGVHRHSREEGNFPWALAFHPYPENLFDPAFWKDRSAPLRGNAPRVTFQNLEVLPSFLAQPHFLFRGFPRPIALTEQGFHRPDGPDGELLQAAAYALAWKKVSAIPEIESFLYHRHVDHPNEHGLRCGIREFDAAAARGLGRARKIHTVMSAAGTPAEDAAFAFALPLLKRTSWEGLLAPVMPHEPGRHPGKENAEKVLVDLLRASSEPAAENLQSVEKRHVGNGEEGPKRAVLLHPRQQGAGRWIFKEIALPQSNGGPGECQLKFEVLLNHPESKGAAFFVEVNGRERFRVALSGAERSAHAIDMRASAGQTIELTLGVDSLGDPSYDWCTWIEPRIVYRSPAAERE
jgi:hypothetical protein